jgi:hypothetical protein
MMDVCRSYTIKPDTVHYKQDKQTENAGERDFFFFGATAPIWTLAYLHETLRFTSDFWIFRQSVGLLGWVISSSQGLYLYTNTETHTQRLHIHALSGIRTHDPGFRAS